MNNITYLVDPYSGGTFNNKGKDVEMNLGTSGATYTTRNTESGSVLETGINTSAGSNSDVGVKYSQTHNKKAYSNQIDSENINVDLRVSNEKKILNGIMGDSSYRLLNGESSGLSTTDSVESTISATLGVNRNSGIGVKVSKTVGDQFNNTSKEFNVGVSTKSRSLVGVSASTMSGKTSENAKGFAIGARVNKTGVEPVLSYISVKNGVKREINLGGIIFNFITQNYLGLSMNIYDAVVGQKVDVPRFEVIQPDEKPRNKPEIAMFEKGKVELTNVAKEQLDLLVENFKNDPDMKIQLGKYYDDGITFNQDKKEKLSDERDAAIRSYLFENGIGTDSIADKNDKFENNNDQMKLADRNTNITIQTSRNFKSDNGATFHAARFSPLGEEKMKEIESLAEFKELSKGKTDIEKEILANVIFHSAVLKDNEKIDPKETLALLKEKVYDEGGTLSNALVPLDDKKVKEVVKKDEAFNEYVENKGINGKEKDLLNDYIVKLNDEFKTPLVGSLNAYEKNYASRGISLEKEDEFKKIFMQELHRNDNFQTVMKDRNKNEIDLAEKMIYGEYMGTGSQEKVEDFISNTVATVHNAVYQNGQTLESKFANFENGDYQKRRKDEMKTDIKNNDLYKNLKNSLSKEELKELNQQMLQYSFNNPNEKINDDVIKHFGGAMLEQKEQVAVFENSKNPVQHVEKADSLTIGIDASKSEQMYKEAQEKTALEERQAKELEYYNNNSAHNFGGR